MSKLKVEKVPVDRMGEWPLDRFIDMRDNPERPADFSTVGWTFEFRGNFYGDNAHPDLKNKKHYCRWLMPSQTCHEGVKVRKVFIDRCHKEGVTFVYLFKQISPPSTADVRQIEEFNAKLVADRGQAAGQIENAA